MRKTTILQNSELFGRVADRFAKIVAAIGKKGGRASVVVSGGTTPVGLYKILVSERFEPEIDWENIDFFIGDERDVSPESVRSNFNTAKVNLFEPLGIDPSQILRWPTEIIDANEVARKYEQMLVRRFDLKEGEFPRFDLLLLGMGDDGHTASLFPYTDGLKERKRIAIVNRVEKLDTARLTLTFPAINSAANIIIMVSGEAKATAVRQALKGPLNCQKTPVQCVDPKKGRVEWFLDKEAAGQLGSG